MNKHQEGREIRVFISSTFQDMQAERDYLITKIFPQLQAESQRRDVNVVPVDLRWGITDEESRSGKVIEICLQEIENSHPFFIGLVGSRYGWCPPAEELLRNDVLRERWGDWLQYDIKAGLSVTEIEMQYGVLRSSAEMNAYFYIRQGTDEGDIKLQRLKRLIRQNGRYPVADYVTAEDLGERVRQDFLHLLDQLYPERQLSELESMRAVHRSYLHSRCTTYIARPNDFQTLDLFVRSSEHHQLVIYGDSGIGKSALVANWLYKRQDSLACKLIAHFVGCGGQESSYRHIVRRICLEIAEQYRVPVADDLPHAFSQIQGREPLLLVLDGIDQLYSEEEAKMLVWLPTSAANVKYLLTTTTNDPTLAVVHQRSYLNGELKPLDIRRRKQLVDSYLGHYRKSLTVPQIERIVNGKLSHNTMILCTLLNELVVFGSHEQLDQRIDYYVTADNSDEFYVRVMRRFETDYGQTTARTVFSLLAFARNGLSEPELLSITGLRQLEWSQFYCGFRSLLRNNNGLIVFVHQHLQTAVCHYYACNEKKTRQRIATYFADKEGMRSIEEQAWQYYLLRERGKLHHLLMSAEVFKHLYVTAPYDLGRYWRLLEGRYSLTEYHRLNIHGDAERAVLYNNMGEFASSVMREFGVAIDFLVKALKLFKQVEGDHSLDIAMACDRLGKIYIEKEDNEKAFAYLKEALDIKHQNFGEHHVETARTYQLIGKAFRLDSSESVTSGKYLRKALAVMENVSGKDSLNVADVLTDLARLHNDSPKEHMRSIVIKRALLGEDHPSLAENYEGLARRNYEGQGQQYFEHAHRISASTFGRMDSRTRNISWDKFWQRHENMSCLLQVMVLFVPLLALPLLWWLFSFWTALQLIVGFWSICVAVALVAEQIRLQNYVLSVLMISFCAIPNVLMWWLASMFTDFHANWKTGLMVAGFAVVVFAVVGYILEKKDYKDITEKNTWAESELKRAVGPQENNTEDKQEQLSQSLGQNIDNALGWTIDEQDDDKWSLGPTSGGCLIILSVPLSIWIGFQWGLAIGVGVLVTLFLILSALIMRDKMMSMLLLGMAVYFDLLIYLIVQYGFIQGLLIGLGVLAVLFVTFIIVFVLYHIFDSYR